MTVSFINKIALVILLIILFFISVGVVIAIQFQNKQSKKYKECLKIIKDKEDGTLRAKNGVSTREIKKIDTNVDVKELMSKLYDTYLEFTKKLNNNDPKISSVLDEFINNVYQNRLEIYKAKNTKEITDSIELTNYTILNFEKKRVEFRISYTCFNYKMMNDVIISGSNLEKVEQVVIVTYSKLRKKWVINNIEKVYDKKLEIQ